jgi:signal transduction histidine kinase
MATILVVDDRSTNREFVVTLLGYAGYRLLEAAGAVEALERTRAMRPDLVIVDILMPEMDGFEFVRRLRADPSIAQTRVVFYTATYLEAETRELARACGVEYVIVKPAEPEVIFDTIRAVLDLDEPASAPPLAAEFDREHGRLLLDKLSQKVNELEQLNAGLEQRVQERTAELGAANVRLQELNRLKDEFMAIASHDLRSPLASIQMLVYMLLEHRDTISADQQQAYIQQIGDATRHLIALVSDLLDLAKLEAGQMRLERSELRASELARRSIDTLGFSARAKEIALDLVVAPGEPPLFADSFKFSQVVNNLLSNAIKFTPRGGAVTVTVAPEPGGICLSVADSGLGIAREALPQLFEKFKQTHASGTAGEQGTGLGLAIVRQLVELHGGWVEVASELGRGSTFTVHLPHGAPGRAAPAKAASEVG